MIKKGKLGLFVLFTSLLVTVPQPGWSAELSRIDDSDTVWIVGYDVNGFSCWSLSSSKQVPILQVKISNKWVNKAKARISKNSSLCSDKKYPWVATYNWRVDEFGQTPHFGNSSRDLMAREYIPKNATTNAYYGSVFVKQVYASNDERIRDGVKAFEEMLGLDSDSPISTPTTTSKFSGCTYKGKKLYGKVQIVDFLPDIKVQVVDFLPDLNVQVVDFLPSSCGKWQFVDFLPDLKIQFVDFLPDVKIKYVDFLPGLR